MATKDLDFWLREFDRFIDLNKRPTGPCPECESKETHITNDDAVFHCENCGYEEEGKKII